MSKYIYMTVKANTRASTTALTYETDAIPDGWTFVSLTILNSDMFMVLRREVKQL